MKFLVTGGAGYIGSHIYRDLKSKGYQVDVIDDLSTGNSWAVDKKDISKIDIKDKNKVNEFFSSNFYNGVFHCAGKSLVSESIKNPIKYIHNNVLGSLNIFSAMIENKINNVVFSSSAAIYGIPKSKSIKESDKKNPINPYGRSKLMVEELLEDLYKSSDLNSVSLRYFNAAGADSSGEIGEAHFPETHLIPNIIFSAIDKSKGVLNVYGNDYDTHDGTAIRDYVHVDDLVNAHYLAMKKLIKGSNLCSQFNLGCGYGYSILDIINAVSENLGENVSYITKERRPGDPDILVADNRLAFRELNWEPKSNLDDIVSTAIKWHKNMIKKLNVQT